MSRRPAHAEAAPCWGVFREAEHSPGRESDDTEILRLTAKHLEARGFQVTLKTADEVTSTEGALPRGVFLMCERPESLQHLHALQRRGIPHVNGPGAVFNTYRERMVEQLREAGVPFVRSDVVATTGPCRVDAFPVWLKRADVHYTEPGDVVRVETDRALRDALATLATRALPRAIVQPHLEGDLVKFYGIGHGRGPDGGPAWFRWFYHREQRLAGHGFDPAVLARSVRRAAAALGLEVYGGDAIVTATHEVILLDVNAWPSFALYREEAAERIAAHLARRFAGRVS
jgi:hypothetical protein